MRTVCVYEDPTMYGTHGITTAVRHQQMALKSVGVNVKKKPVDPYDVMHFNWYGPISYYQLQRAKRKGKATIVFAHSGEDVKGGFTLSKYLAKPFIKWLVSFYTRGDVLIAPSEYTKEMVVSYGINSSDVKVVSNGVEHEKAEFSSKKRKRYKNKFSLNKPTVIGVGQVIPRKGITTFIEAARRLPEYDFIWYGTRMNKVLMYDRKMEKAIHNSPSNVQFSGYVEDIQAAYSSGDLFFFPSHEENQGIVILEAAVRGIPIVLRDLPVYRGWLEDGENCLKGENLDQFVELIREGMEDKPLRDKLTDRASRMAEKHRLEKVGQQYKEIYDLVL